MTKLTDQEDIAFLGPEQMEADIKASEIECIWKPLAEKNGWVYSESHKGFIRQPEYYVEGRTAEEACYISGYSDILEAIEALYNE
ncbi:hypothetical protein [Caulobacter phage Cr30]|uniref:hypothetical protein n=1 Tax=Caulobacter phage Cr30 TaxID=1357714 RepID=UPI0004A9B77E|nr:hypothetical protein OZ74_gp158 [Caulobacter phage Cr30]AGS81043.1 hypothetical protein [Caulobacter phage Cr30]